jgi:hypothetical protein
VKANDPAALLVPLLRDLYLTVEEDTISLDELMKFLAATSSPFKIYTWCILFLLSRLQKFTILRAEDLHEDDRSDLRAMWELISKHAYCNYYKCVSFTEKSRDKNRFQKPWLWKQPGFGTRKPYSSS